MEYCGDADLGAEMARIGGDCGECLSGSVKQERVDDGLILEGDRTCRRRQGEDDVEIRHRQQLGLPLSEPLHPRWAPGSAPPPRQGSHWTRAGPWHFGQWRLRQEL